MSAIKSPGSVRRRDIVIALAAIIALVVLVPSVGSGEVSHKNYDEADVDPLIFCYLLDNAIGQINGYLMNSDLDLDPDGDGIVDEDELKHRLLGEHKALIQLRLTHAQWNRSRLNTSLTDAQMTKEDIIEFAQSFQYLEDILTPYLDFNNNLSRHWGAHQELVAALLNLADLYFDTEMDQKLRNAKGLENVTASMDDLRTVRETHQNMQINALGLKEVELEDTYFDYSGLEDIDTNLSELEHQYDYYQALIDFFSRYIVVDGPSLVLELDKDRYYLKEDMIGSGYFITGTSLNTSLSATISLNGNALQSAFTNSFGTFTFTVNIPLDTPIGEMNISARLSYLGEYYTSDPVFVPVEKIPVRIAFSMIEPDLSPGETLEVEGKVTDHYGDPMSSGLMPLELVGEQYDVVTTQDGGFQLDIDLAEFEFGYHPITGRFPETTHHQSSRASTFFRVNVETILTIEAENTNIDVGDTVWVTGTLSTVDREFLDGREVILYVDEEYQETLITINGEIEAKVQFDTVGTHIVHIEFISDDPGLRNATSTTITLDVESRSTGSDPLFLNSWAFLLTLAVLLVIAGLLTLSIIIRRRGKTRRMRPTVSSPGPEKKPKEEPSKEDIEPRPSEELVTAILEDAGIADLADLSSEQEAVVLQYQLFLRYVRGKGHLDVGSLTPNEIRRMLRGTSIPAASVNKITRIFNRAFYTQTRVTTKDMETMVNEVDRITWGGRE